MVLNRELGLRIAREDGTRSPKLVPQIPTYEPAPYVPPIVQQPAPIVQPPVYYPPPPPVAAPAPVYSPPPAPAYTPEAYIQAVSSPQTVQDLEYRTMPAAQVYSPPPSPPVYTPPPSVYTPPPPPPPPPAPTISEPLPAIGVSDWRVGGREARMAELSGGEYTAQGNFNYATAPPPPTAPQLTTNNWTAGASPSEQANNRIALETALGGGGGGLVTAPDPVFDGSMTTPQFQEAVRQEQATYSPAVVETPSAGLSNPPPAPAAPTSFEPAPAAPTSFEPAPAAPYTDPTPVYQAPEQTQAAPQPTSVNPGATAPSSPAAQAAQAAIQAVSRRSGNVLYNQGRGLGLHIPKIGLPNRQDSDPAGGQGSLGELQAQYPVTMSSAPSSGGFGSFNTGLANDEDKTKMANGLPMFEDGGVMPDQGQGQVNLEPDDPRMMEMNVAEAARNNPQQIQQIQQAVIAAIQSGELTMEELNQMVQLAKLAMQQPEAWQQIRQYAIQQGVAEEDEIPQQYDKGLLYVILLAGKAVQDMAVGSAPQGASGPQKAGLIPKFENGGVVPSQLSDGHKLAYIKPGEAVLHQGVVAAMGRKWVETQNAKWNKDGTPVEKPTKSS